MKEYKFKKLDGSSFLSPDEIREVKIGASGTIGVDLAGIEHNISGIYVGGLALDLPSSEDYVAPSASRWDQVIPLASSFHDFKSPALAEAYKDLDLTPAGIGYLEDIPALKDLLITGGKAIHVPRLTTNKTGFYYLRKLSRQDRKAYIKNFKAQNKPAGLKWWLLANFDNLDEFLYLGSKWDNTPEGWDYWNRLSEWARWTTKHNTIIYDGNY